MKKPRLYLSFTAAFKGIWWNYRHERNAFIHLCAIVITSFLGWYLRISLPEWLILCLFFALIPCLELVNSALEQICNTVRDTLKLNYEATRLPRDLAAGAVLWACLLAVLAGLIIFLPKIYYLFLTV